MPQAKSKREGKTYGPRKAYGPRADLGAAAQRYFAQQTPEKRALLEKLHGLVMKAAPSAEVSIKWGVPVYVVGGRNACAIAAFKEHVALNLFAPPSLLTDPKGRLEGEGKASRSLKVRTAKDIDAASVTRWVKAAART